MQAAAALTEDRGICRDDRRLSSALPIIHVLRVSGEWASGPSGTLNKQIVSSLARHVPPPFPFPPPLFLDNGVGLSRDTRECKKKKKTVDTK